MVGREGCHYEGCYVDAAHADVQSEKENEVKNFSLYKSEDGRKMVSVSLRVLILGTMIALSVGAFMAVL